MSKLEKQIHKNVRILNALLREAARAGRGEVTISIVGPAPRERGDYRQIGIQLRDPYWVTDGETERTALA